MSSKGINLDPEPEQGVVLIFVETSGTSRFLVRFPGGKLELSGFCAITLWIDVVGSSQLSNGSLNVEDHEEVVRNGDYFQDRAEIDRCSRSIHKRELGAKKQENTNEMHPFEIVKESIDITWDISLMFITGVVTFPISTSFSHCGIVVPVAKFGQICVIKCFIHHNTLHIVSGSFDDIELNHAEEYQVEIVVALGF